MELEATCWSCGKTIGGDNILLGGKIVCLDCYEELDLCYECAAIEQIDELQDYHGNWLCESCYDNHFAHCSSCEELYDTDNSDSWGGMCPECCEEHFICNDCGRAYHDDDYGEDGYCRNCMGEDDEDNLIKSYHIGPAHGFVFHPEDESLYFGVELETDDYDDRTLAARDLIRLSRDERLFWLEKDCSLRNGIEIISQPCTLAYHEGIFPWGKILRTVRLWGGKGERTDSAALHIHFSAAFFSGKRSELYQLRLVYLFEKFRTELLKLARTSEYLSERSARAYGISLFDRTSTWWESPERKISQLKAYRSRMQAVNLCSSQDTIEIRIFRSTLAVKTLLASIELVDFLVRLAKKTSTRRLQTITWADLLKRITESGYFYLPSYIENKEAELGD